MPDKTAATVEAVVVKVLAPVAPTVAVASVLGIPLQTWSYIVAIIGGVLHISFMVYDRFKRRQK